MIKGRIICFMVCAATVVYAEWGTYHGRGDLRGVSDAKLPEKPEMLWRYTASGAVYNPPVSAGERIFFSAQKGRVVAVDLNGSEIWSKSFTRTNDLEQVVPVRFEAPLACNREWVLAGSTRGTLYALDVETGREEWRYETGGSIVGSPGFIRDSIVVLDQSEGALHGLNAETGKRLWKTEGVERCDGSPGVGGGRIVFGSCLAALHVFSGVDGKHQRDIELGADEQIAGGVAVDGPVVFAGTRAGSLVCADAEAGDVVWSSDESEEQTFSTPVVTEKRIVYSSDDGFVYAVRRADGVLIWKFDTEGLPTSPVVSKDKVVVCADGKLFLLGLEGGDKKWVHDVSDETSSPSLIGNMIVVGADDGSVTAWGAKRPSSDHDNSAYEF